MDGILQNQIEDYVAGTMAGKEKQAFEIHIKNDLNLYQQVEDLKRVREAMFRARVRINVANARASVNKPQKGFMYIFGSFSAAASILFFLLSTPISLTSKKFNYRGEALSVSSATQVRADNYEKASRMIETGDNTTEAIRILEQLKSDDNVSKNYQNESKWMLVVAYLQAGEAQKAEEVFDDVKWEESGRVFSTWAITKIKWKIFWGKLF